MKINGIEIISFSFLKDIAAGLGIIDHPKIKYFETSDPEGNRAQIKKDGFGVYVCASRKPGFFQKAVSYGSNSWAQHTGIFLSKALIDDTMKKHPELYGKRRLPGTTTEAGILPPVPPVYDDAIIESQVTIAFNSLKNVTREDEQIIFFLPDYSGEQIEKIAYSALFMYGAPYDIFEIGNWALAWMPNLKQIKVCSSFVASAIEAGDPDLPLFLRSRGIDPGRCSPGHIGQYFFQRSSQTIVAFGCDIDNAKRLI